MRQPVMDVIREAVNQVNIKSGLKQLKVLVIRSRMYKSPHHLKHSKRHGHLEWTKRKSLQDAV